MEASSRRGPDARTSRDTAGKSGSTPMTSGTADDTHPAGDAAAHRAIVQGPIAPGVAVHGVVVRGHGVASGQGTSSPFPGGTIALQRPVFAELGLDLDDMYPGTINVDVAPARYELRRPARTFVGVDWTDVHGPETFSFLTCRLTRAAGPEASRGWVYYPHPETKPMHEQPGTVLEVLMPYLPGLGYGDEVTLHLDPAEIAVSGGA